MTLNLIILNLLTLCGVNKQAFFINPDPYQAGIRGPGGPGPPLTLGFEAPKLSFFGPYLIFHNFFLPRLARHIISFICCFSKFKFKNFPASLHSAYDFSPRSLCF